MHELHSWSTLSRFNSSVEPFLIRNCLNLTPHFLKFPQTMTYIAVYLNSARWYKGESEWAPTIDCSIQSMIAVSPRRVLLWIRYQGDIPIHTYNRFKGSICWNMELHTSLHTHGHHGPTHRDQCGSLTYSLRIAVARSFICLPTYPHCPYY
jgi:hypothetical protein